MFPDLRKLGREYSTGQAFYRLHASARWRVVLAQVILVVPVLLYCASWWSMDILDRLIGGIANRIAKPGPRKG